jgi:hypothetical protein
MTAHAGMIAAVCALAPLAVQAQAATPPTLTEMNASVGAQRIGAFTAPALASRGQGVTIAIIDTGVRTDHLEFEGALLPGFNAFTNAVGPAAQSDSNGHGTHVASLAAARANGFGIAGVASAASILPIQVFNGPSSTTDIVARGVNYATSQRAFVMNLSLGGAEPTWHMESALGSATRAGLLVVIGAGNDGQDNPNWPARYASHSWANGQIIAVGAVDAANQIAAFSNRAGDAMNFFLVAPGVSLRGAYNTSPTALVRMTGTSMATPIVSGAAAVVKGAWPALSARTVAEILFQTATDLGAPGVDPIFGRGLLNLERALQPVGGLRVQGAGGPAPLSPLTGGLGAATFGPLSVAANAGALRGAVYDDFDRDFGYDFGRIGADMRPDGVSLLAASLQARLDRMEQTATGLASSRFVAAPGFAQAGLAPAGAVGALNDDGSGWAAALGLASPLLGQATAPIGAVAPKPAAFASAVSLFSERSASVAMRRAAGQSLMLTLGARVQDAATPRKDLFWTAPALAQTASVEAEVAHAGERWGWRAGLSTVRETKGRLGARENAALALDGAAMTTALQLEAVRAVTPRLTLAATATLARTGQQEGTRLSLVRRADAVDSVGYAVTLAATDALAQGDRLDLTLGSPLSSRTGGLDLMLGVGADAQTGAPILAERRIDFAAGAQELRLEAAYARPVGDTGHLALALLTRQDADGVAGAQDQAALIRFQTRF